MYNLDAIVTAPSALARQVEDLRRTILASRLAYQPQAGLQGASYGKTVGYEALLRIGMDPSPEPLLSAIEALPPADRLACHRTLLEHNVPAALRVRAMTGRDVAVNVPVCVLEDRGARIWLAAHAPGLTLEILETEPVHDWGLVRRTLGVLRAHGSRIAIDDYGAEHWNALALIQLPPVDAVKVDRALLRTANGRVLLPYLVRAIHALGAKAVVEGVESKVDHVTAVAAGADAGQGYWYGLPSTLPMGAFGSVVPPSAVRVA